MIKNREVTGCRCVSAARLTTIAHTGHLAVERGVGESRAGHLEADSAVGEDPAPVDAENRSEKSRGEAAIVDSFDALLDENEVEVDFSDQETYGEVIASTIPAPPLPAPLPAMQADAAKQTKEDPVGQNAVSFELSATNEIKPPAPQCTHDLPPGLHFGDWVRITKVVTSYTWYFFATSRETRVHGTIAQVVCPKKVTQVINGTRACLRVADEDGLPESRKNVGCWEPKNLVIVDSVYATD